MSHISTLTAKKHTTQSFPSIFLPQWAIMYGQDPATRKTEARQFSHGATITFLPLPLHPLDLVGTELWQMGLADGCQGEKGEHGIKGTAGPKWAMVGSYYCG